MFSITSFCRETVLWVLQGSLEGNRVLKKCSLQASRLQFKPSQGLLNCDNLEEPWENLAITTKICGSIASCKKIHSKTRQRHHKIHQHRSEWSHRGGNMIGMSCFSLPAAYGCVGKRSRHPKEISRPRQPWR